jgi:hypothetical protein
MSILIGRRDIDFRYDPLNGALVPQEILGTDGSGNGEVHQAVAIEGLPGRFGFSPNEMPQRRTDIADSGIVVYEVDSSNNLTGFSALGDALVQVRPPIGGQPGPNEYAVDFNNPINFLNTGRFFFNPSDSGKFYRIHRYFGLGSINSVRNTFFIEQAALLTKLSRDGSLPMTGDLNFDGFKGVGLANGTNAGDAVNFGQLDGKVSKSGDTMTGNLSIPAGTINAHAVNRGQLNSLFNSFQASQGYSNNNPSANAFVYYVEGNVNITGCPNTAGTVIIVNHNAGSPGVFELRVHGQVIGNTPSGSSISRLIYNRGVGSPLWLNISQTP